MMRWDFSNKVIPAIIITLILFIFIYGYIGLFKTKAFKRGSFIKVFWSINLILLTTAVGLYYIFFFLYFWGDAY